jgi:hypothetical protein
MDENLQNFFNRANTLRIRSEFDKAAALYEKIIQADPTQSEAYWGLILCKYGIEYVDDPATLKKIPTCHRASYDSIIADDDYKSALANADMSQRIVYEEQAREIDRIQKDILALAQKEEKYDVFICYKETDADGKRTQDSVIANDIYYQLTNEGFKVFYAAITLEGKLGSAYEPIIFAALNSAKVMLAIGTKTEYFNAVWVKNEWSRFLNIVKKDRSKLLIPCYRDMDAYELPEEFAHLQAQDMSKIGFINDIVRGMKKVIKKDEVKQTVANSVSNSSDTETLLKRVTLFLEGGDWGNADIYCEKVLDIDPENTKAYIFKLLAQLHATKEEDLAFSNTPLEGMLPYKNALRFADEDTAKRLIEYNRVVKENLAKRERERQEQARIERERRQQEEKKQQEINALQTARNNATNLISAQINEQARLKGLIAKKQAESLTASNPKKIRILSIFVLLWAAISFIFLIVFAVSASESSDPNSGGVVIFLLCSLLFMIFSAKLLKADGKPVVLVILNIFTYGIFIIVIAFIALKKSKKNKAAQYAQEISALNTQLQQVESQIDITRHSLSEINQKLETHK